MPSDHAYLRDFTTPPLLGGPNRQTLLGKALRPRLSVPLRRQRMELPDGDFVDLDAWTGCERSRRPLVLLLHGLEGSSARRYMLVTYEALIAQGLAPIGMNFRGCSGEPNRLVRAYHSGDTGDLRHVIGALATAFPQRPLALIGFSLGGNVILKFLGERGPESSHVRAAAVVSVPFDLAAGADTLERPGLRALYRFYFLRSLRGKIVAKRELLDDVIDVDAAIRASTIREFDDVATAPIHGFQNADDYYERSSSGPYVPRIETPTLVVHARDDPFLPASAIPEAEIRDNPALTLALMDTGGHVGFVSSHPDGRRFWAESAVARYVAERMTCASSRDPIDGAWPTP